MVESVRKIRVDAWLYGRVAEALEGGKVISRLIEDRNGVVLHRLCKQEVQFGEVVFLCPLSTRVLDWPTGLKELRG